jgi:uncharacterized protein (TIRG00374 family)
MKRWISIILPFIGLALFVAIVYRTGWDRILGTLQDINTGMLPYAVAIMAAVVLLRGWRWQLLMRPIGIDYPLRRSAVVWMIGFFASAVTPAKVGDAVRALYVRSETEASFGEAFLSVFMDRLWDLITVLVAGIVTALLFSHYYIQIPSIWVLIAGAVTLIAVVFLVTRRSLVQRLLRPLFNLLIPGRYKEQFSLNFHAFYDALQLYRRRPMQMVAILLLTLVYWALVFTLAVYVTRLLGIEVGPEYVVLIMPIVTLVELIPISVSGLGTRDATVIYFFSLVGATSAQAVGFSLVYVLIGTYLTSALGFFFWLRNPVGLGGGD